MKRNIVIADTSSMRSNEMEKLALGTVQRGIVDVTLFDGNRSQDRVELAGQIVSHVESLIQQEQGVIVVANCMMGVKTGLLEALGNIRTPNQQLLKRILLTCKKPDEVAVGFAERGLNIDGIEHVVWNAFDMSYHQDRMRSIFLNQ